MAIPLTLAGYEAGRGLREEVHVGDGPVEAVLEQLLARQDVDYIHVRDTAAGCYDFRIERAEPIRLADQIRAATKDRFGGAASPACAQSGCVSAGSGCHRPISL